MRTESQRHCGAVTGIALTFGNTIELRVGSDGGGESAMDAAAMCPVYDLC